MPPDLIFLDIEMPGKSGVQLAEEIVQEQIELDIVFTTAYNDFAIKAFRLSAIDYLLKPFDRERFDEAIDKFLAIRENYTPFDMYRAIRKIEGDTKYKNSKLSEETIDEYAKKNCAHNDCIWIVNSPSCLCFNSDDIEPKNCFVQKY